MRYSLLLLLILMLVACKDEPLQVVKKENDLAETMVKVNKEAIRLEQRDITNYLRRNGFDAQQTGTGLHYVIIEDYPGDRVKPDDEVLFEYQVSLLNGRVCYASEAGQPESFVVEYEDVESGLHEGMQLLSPGDSAMLVIPSHLAHGLAGDLDEIPMRSTIIYHVRLLDKR